MRRCWCVQRTACSLTSVGRRLVEHTERILIELRAAEATMHQDSTEIAGRLKVGGDFPGGRSTDHGTSVDR